MEGAAAEPKVIRFGEFELDLAGAELRRRGRKLRLERQPFHVLAVLVSRAGKLVTREELQHELWSDDTFVEFDHSLNTATNKIRRALDDAARKPRFIETVPGQGYRFIAAVDRVGAHARIEERPEPQVATLARKHRLLWVGSMAAIAAVASLAIWLATGRHPQNDAAMRVVPLTSYPGDEQWPSFSPDGNEVAFQWNRDGDWDIFIKQIGVEEAFQLTDTRADDVGPAWSPLGDQIAFLRLLGSPRRMQVVLVPQRGGPERVLTEFSGIGQRARFETCGLAWTPAGRWLIVAAQEGKTPRQQLFRVSTTSGESTPLTFADQETTRDSWPAVSPDGRDVVFVRNGELWTLPLGRGYGADDDPIRMFLLDDWDCHHPAWSPDGGDIVFSAYNGPLRRLKLSNLTESEHLLFTGTSATQPTISADGNRMAFATRPLDWDIWKLPLNQRDGQPATPFPIIRATGTDSEPTYSPDGSRIAFGTWRSGFAEIWLCDSDGTNLANVSSFGDRGTAWRPRWSPDGEQIAFNARIGGNNDIYLVRASGGEPRRLTNHPAGDFNPEWSSDGRQIYFISHRDVTKRVWKIPAGGGTPSPSILSSCAPKQSPDGKFLYAVDGYPDEVTLWRTPVEGGESMKMASNLSSMLAWQPVENGIYFIGRPDAEGKSRIQFKSLETDAVTTLAVIDQPNGWGLAVSPDRESLLYVQQERVGGDLMLVENFQ